MITAILFSLIPIQSGTTPPKPPYKREATVSVYESSYSPQSLVVGSFFYTVSGDRCLAFALPSMKKVWTAKLPKTDRGEYIAFANGTIFVCGEPYDRGQKPHLLAYDAKSGKPSWQVPRSGEGSPMAIVGGTIYTSLKPQTLSAIDLKTRRTIWTTQPWKTAKDQGDYVSVRAVSASESVVVFNTGNATVAVNAKNGNPLWNQSESYMYEGTLSISAGVVWIDANEGSVGRDLQSGKVLWNLPKNSSSEFSGVSRGNFVGLDNGKAAAIDPKKGTILWSYKVGDERTSGGYQYGSVLGDLIYIVGLDESFICDPKGKKIWSGKATDMPPRPIWTDGKCLVSFDGERLMRYVHGEEAPMPTDSASRQGLAIQMVSKYDQLDEADKKRLVSLGDDAFQPLLAEFVKTCEAHDSMGEKGDSYPLYSRYHDLAQLLVKTTSAKRSPDIISAFEKATAKSSAKPFLLQLLARYGEPSVVTPYFLKELERERTPDFEMYESATYVARTYILSSNDPRAVAFMLKQLRDPKGDHVIKLQAYWHLAGTGGEEGLKAVLDLQNKRTQLRPVTDRVLTGFLGAGEFGSKTKPLSEKKSADGRSWCLLESGVLGSRGDLYLAEKVSDKLVSAFFLGVSTSGVSRWAKPAPPEQTVEGKTAKEIVAADWVKLLVGKANITKDSDHDGLTDIEEKRLSTDPSKADMDGDGDQDGIDPWPNAPNRVLSDEEQIMSAAFEARYHDSGSEGPGLFYGPKGMKPFEMPGRKGTMIWVAVENDRWSLPLEQCYEQGIAFIRMSPIQWSKDKSQATIEVSTAYGGLNGTGYQAVVKKFGDKWVVISMRQSWVS